MAVRTKVPFTIQPSDPMVMEVESADGTAYRVSLRLAVLQVEDTGNRKEDGLPVFSVQAQLLAETSKPE